MTQTTPKRKRRKSVEPNHSKISKATLKTLDKAEMLLSTDETIKKVYESLITKSQQVIVTRALTRLSKTGHIDIIKIDNKRHYEITDKGIQLLTKWMTH